MTYDLFVSGVGVNSDVFLQIDRFDGISYVEKTKRELLPLSAKAIIP